MFWNAQKAHCKRQSDSWGLAGGLRDVALVDGVLAPTPAMWTMERRGSEYGAAVKNNERRRSLQV